MSSSKGGRFIVRMPRSLHESLAIEADNEGVSLNQLLVCKVSEQRGSMNIVEAVDLLAEIVEHLLDAIKISPDVLDGSHTAKATTVEKLALLRSRIGSISVRPGSTTTSEYLQLVEHENRGLVQSAREWIQEGWGLGPDFAITPLMLAAAIEKEAITQRASILDGTGIETDPAYPARLREIASKIAALEAYALSL